MMAVPRVTPRVPRVAGAEGGGTRGVLGPATLGVLGAATLAPSARDAAYVAGAAAALEAAAALARDRDLNRGHPTASQVERERAAEETGRLREANRHLRPANSAPSRNGS